MSYLLIFGIVFVLSIIIGVAITKNQEKKRKDRFEQEAASIPNFTPIFSINGMDNHYYFAVDKRNEIIVYISEAGKHVIKFQQVFGSKIIDDTRNASKLPIGKFAARTLVGKAVGGNLGAALFGFSTGRNNFLEHYSVKVQVGFYNPDPVIVEIPCFDCNLIANRKPARSDGMSNVFYTKGLQDAENIVAYLDAIVKDYADKKSN